MIGYGYERGRKILWFPKMTTITALLDDRSRWQLWTRMEKEKEEKRKKKKMFG